MCLTLVCLWQFLPGGRTGSSPHLRQYMRLSFSWYEAEVLEEGVKRLREAVLGAAAEAAGATGHQRVESRG